MQSCHCITLTRSATGTGAVETQKMKKRRKKKLGNGIYYMYTGHASENENIYSQGGAGHREFESPYYY